MTCLPTGLFGELCGGTVFWLFMGWEIFLALWWIQVMIPLGLLAVLGQVVFGDE